MRRLLNSLFFFSFFLLYIQNYDTTTTNYLYTYILFSISFCCFLFVLLLSLCLLSSQLKKNLLLLFSINKFMIFTLTSLSMHLYFWISIDCKFWKNVSSAATFVFIRHKNCSCRGDIICTAQQSYHWIPNPRFYLMSTTQISTAPHAVQAILIKELFAFT